MADDEAGRDRVLALEDVHVGAADRRRRDSQERVARTDVRNAAFLKLDLAGADEDGRFHHPTIGSREPGTRHRLEHGLGTHLLTAVEEGTAVDTGLAASRDLTSPRNAL